MVFRVALIGKMLNHSPFLSPKSEHIVLHVRKKRGRYESSQVKASPISRSRMRPPTPLQNSNDAFEEAQERFVVDDQMWSARERTIIARIKQYLEESYSVKVEVRRMGRSAGSG